MKCCYILN